MKSSGPLVQRKKTPSPPLAQRGIKGLAVGHGLTSWVIDRFGGLLDLVPHPQEVTAPQLGDIGFGVTALEQFGGDVAGVADVLPALKAAAIVEVRRNADVIDADLAHGVVDGIPPILEGGLGFVFENGVQRLGVLAE